MVFRYLQYAVLSLVLLTACSCGSIFPYSSRTVKHEFESAVEVHVDCSDGKSFRGSGVAIGPNRVLTAQHTGAACGAALPMYFVIGRDGVIRGGVVRGRSVPEFDAIVLETYGPLLVYTQVRTQPLVGEKVCTVTAHPVTDAYAYTCGFVSHLDGPWIVVSMEIFPGDSGGPLYDAKGRVLGVWMGGTDREKTKTRVFGMAIMVEKYLDILPSTAFESLGWRRR